MFRNTEDAKFSSFMVQIIKLFATDRRLLETRGNLIIRQLCLSLSAERIYRTLADCLDRDEDVEFTSIMVQNLNNNLITAPELADLRKRLRNLDSRVRCSRIHWRCATDKWGRTGKRSLLLFSGPGAIMLWLLSHCAFWPKLTNRPTTCCRFCEVWFLALERQD